MTLYQSYNFYFEEKKQLMFDYLIRVKMQLVLLLWKLDKQYHFLNNVKEVCELRGWYYQYKGINSIPLKLLLAINNWESWRKGCHLNTLEIKNIYESDAKFINIIK